MTSPTLPSWVPPSCVLPCEDTSMFSRVVLVNPALAEAWLEMNYEDNRKPIEKYVDHLTGQMKSGEWVTTHQSVAFTPEGILIDGQHRLRAIVQSRRAAHLYVTFNVPLAAFKYTDKAKPRSVADNLALKSGWSRHLIPFLERMRATARHVSVRGATEMLDEWYPLIAELEQFAPSNRRRLTGTPVRAAALIRARMGSKDYVFEQYRALSLERTQDMSPLVTHLALRLLGGSDRTAKSSAASRDDIQFALAWAGFNPEKQNGSRVMMPAPRENWNEARGVVIQFHNARETTP